MSYTTPLLADSPAANNTGEYKGYDVRVKGDGRVQLTKDDKTWLYHDYIDAISWIDAAEEAALPPPVVSALMPAGAEVGGADLVLQVIGTGFTENTVIVFNGGDEVTTFVSAEEVTTVVKPSLVSAAVSVPVAVRNGSKISNSMDFEFV